jgi:antitoxin MazE
MELQVGKWGNSLALRLPSEVVKRMNLQEGARVQLSMDSRGAALLTNERPPFDKEGYLRRVRELTDNMPMTESVIREMRDGARY